MHELKISKVSININDAVYDSDYTGVVINVELPKYSNVIDYDIINDELTLHYLHAINMTFTEDVKILIVKEYGTLSLHPYFDLFVLSLYEKMPHDEVQNLISKMIIIDEFRYLGKADDKYIFIQCYKFDPQKIETISPKTVLY